MADPNPLTPIETAQRVVMQSVRPTEEETVALSAALGRVLARDVRSDIDFPPFDRAMMDGYAMRTEDAVSADVRLRPCGEIAAGRMPDICVESGSAVRINTGAPVPEGANCVVPIEQIEHDDQDIRVRSAPKKGQHITPRATYVRAGDVVLEKGIFLGASQIAVAATVGAQELCVHQKPRVSVLVTGDELVDAGQKPGPGQIRNSNGPMLTALLGEDGIEAQQSVWASDDPDQLANHIREGLKGDCLCISGGISMGQFDFVPQVLSECGVSMRVRKIAIKPGKPTLFGVAQTGCAVFGLPGNPMSSLVAYRLLVSPALRVMQGASDVLPVEWSAVLEGELKATTDRRSYWPVVLTSGDGPSPVAKVCAWRGSGDPFGFARANALVVQNPHQSAVRTGDPVRVILLRPIRAGGA